MVNAFVYLLRCAHGSYYFVSAPGETLDRRLGEHQSGALGGYTSTRRPVTLVYAEQFGRITDAIEAERRIKGWGQAKKESLIRGDWAAVQWLAKRPGARANAAPTQPPRPEAPPQAASKDAPEGAARASRSADAGFSA